MPDSYTVLWSQDRCRHLKRHDQVGARLEILFGGPHTSEPRFSRFGVQSGDYIYPVHVSDCVLFILGRMRVKRLLTLEEYIAENPEKFAGCEDAKWPGLTLSNWLNLHPEKRYLAWTCTDEVAIGEEGTPIRFDVAVPSELLERLRFRSRRAERGLKNIVDGRLKSAISLQGIYRLGEESAREIESLLIRAKGGATVTDGRPRNFLDG